jgi:hypothetical protein
MYETNIEIKWVNLLISGLLAPFFLLMYHYVVVNNKFFISQISNLQFNQQSEQKLLRLKYLF